MTKSFRGVSVLKGAILLLGAAVYFVVFGMESDWSFSPWAGVNSQVTLLLILVAVYAIDLLLGLIVALKAGNRNAMFRLGVFLASLVAVLPIIAAFDILPKDFGTQVAILGWAIGVGAMTALAGLAGREFFLGLMGLIAAAAGLAMWFVVDLQQHMFLLMGIAPILIGIGWLFDGGNRAGSAAEGHAHYGATQSGFAGYHSPSDGMPPQSPAGPASYQAGGHSATNYGPPQSPQQSPPQHGSGISQ